MSRTITITTIALALGFSLGACEKELHRNGAGPSGPLWRPVYVANDRAHVIEASDAFDPRSRFNLRNTAAVRPGLSVQVDSLRGLHVYEVKSAANADEYVPVGYVTVPGVTYFEEVTGNLIAVDNLGQRVVLDLSDYPDFEIVERLEVASPPPPDVTEPPRPGAADPIGVDYGDEEAFTSTYFICPDASRPGRFLGWRLSPGRQRDDDIDLCRHR